jgi:hypothetical protein
MRRQLSRILAEQIALAKDGDPQNESCDEDFNITAIVFDYTSIKLIITCRNANRY